ncbi:hypothetical protein GOODEAATRI_033316 [Goodea atripinnis]|uniref:Uncharacterized protein n=1 Tax=Goodea atripinnis TaxID=208336 RepID=A0ABV0Q3J5_9TELE
MTEIRCRKPEAVEGQPEGESRCKLVRAAEHSAYFLFSVLTLSPEQELEREISFQGGSGLYYHYYKWMLAAPSFDRGFYELMVDNRTISGQTINAVERLFLYPELITSFIYRITNSQVRRSSVCLCFTLSENCFIIICN